MRHHTLDVYGTELWLATNKREWATLRRKLSFLEAPPDSAGLAQFATWEPKGGGITVPHVVLWVDVKAHRDDVAELVDTIAHEATHAASQILDHAGHDTRGTDEPHAYLVGWLARWLWVSIRGEGE